MFEKGALALLKDDHKTAKDLLDRLTSAKDPMEQEQLRRQVVIELKVHAAVEEEIFYPAAEGALTDQDDQVLMRRALEEHHVAERALDDLLTATAGTPDFLGKAQVVRGLVLIHAQEEEKVMFPKIKRAMDKATIERLGKEIESRKTTLESEVRQQVEAMAATV